MDTSRDGGERFGRAGVLEDHGKDQQAPREHFQVRGHTVHAVRGG